jgi:hypothetical protein
VRVTHFPGRRNLLSNQIEAGCIFGPPNLPLGIGVGGVHVSGHWKSCRKSHCHSLFVTSICNMPECRYQTAKFKPKYIIVVVSKIGEDWGYRIKMRSTLPAVFYFFILMNLKCLLVRTAKLSNFCIFLILFPWKY